MAVVIFGLLIAGYSMTAMAFSPLKLQVYMIHKSFGMTIFALVLARLAWRLYSPPPKALDTHQPWEKILSKIVHLLLYCGMIGLPLSGWLMSSAAEYPNSYFGLFDFPMLSGKDEALFIRMRTLHELFGFMMVAGIGLHFLGAAKHHVIDRDQTLTRMGGNILVLLVGALLLLGATALAGQKLLTKLQALQMLQAQQSEAAGAEIQQRPSAATADTADQTDIVNAPQWLIDKDQSRLELVFTLYGQEVNSRFETFDGEIFFDPDNLERSRVRIEIDIASLRTGSSDRDSEAKSPDWFDTASYPKAVFESESFVVLAQENEETEGKTYQVNGTLTLRGVEMPTSFPFVLVIADDSESESKIAEMSASLTLKRLDFGVGQGQWQSTANMANEVAIKISLRARHAP
jgi:cytochrome b561